MLSSKHICTYLFDKTQRKCNCFPTLHFLFLSTIITLAVFLCVLVKQIISSLFSLQYASSLCYIAQSHYDRFIYYYSSLFIRPFRLQRQVWRQQHGDLVHPGPQCGDPVGHCLALLLHLRVPQQPEVLQAPGPPSAQTGPRAERGDVHAHDCVQAKGRAAPSQQHHTSLSMFTQHVEEIRLKRNLQTSMFDTRLYTLL